MFSAENGFRIGRDKGNVIEVLEIEGQQFRRNIPPPPLYSHIDISYVPSDPLQFPCVNYEDRLILMGEVEESRILEIRYVIIYQYQADYPIFENKLQN